MTLFSKLLYQNYFRLRRSKSSSLIRSHLDFISPKNWTSLPPSFTFLPRNRFQLPRLRISRLLLYKSEHSPLGNYNVRQVSGFTSMDSTSSRHTKSHIFPFLVNSNLVKLETVIQRSFPQWWIFSAFILSASHRQAYHIWLDKSQMKVTQVNVLKTR